jgi:hypothetical protein
MSLRAKWEFEYTAAKLAEAAAAQHAFRVSRIKVWEEKKAEVVAKIKDSGLSVHESIAAGMGSGKYSTSFEDNSAHVMVDPTLQKDLNECVKKINSHTEMRNSYDAWRQVLAANPEVRLKLDHDDWMYFFGK